MSNNIPKHVAIIMDGNGRWAEQRHLPRAAGHKAGVDAVRRTVRVCAEQGVKALTLFAFGQENWRRPDEEVGYLMSLFLSTLKREVKRLHKNNICMQFIGERTRLSEELRDCMNAAEQLTQDNTALTLTIAINYSGRWDIVQATQDIAAAVKNGTMELTAIDEAVLTEHLSLSSLCPPDLFIRTSGEYRLSNFLLWQLAYAELVFSDVLWPDFDEPAFMAALQAYEERERRFGYTGQQLEQLSPHA